MVNLIRDPKGESVMEPTSSTDRAMQQQIQTLKPPTLSQQDEVARLKQRVTELEKELHGKVCEVQSIHCQIVIELRMYFILCRIKFYLMANDNSNYN